MTIEVRIGASTTTIERETFLALFDNSVVHSRADYAKAVDTGAISFQKLVELSRDAQIPYPLFFAPKGVVLAQVKDKSDKLLAGVGKSEYSMNARGRVERRDVELIIKDLLRKQDLYKKHAGKLSKNVLLGCIYRPQAPEDDARKLFEVLGLTGDDLRAQKTKQAAVELFVERLEALHVLVARSAEGGYMPQSVNRVKFSGITVRDPKAPYIFLKGGGHGAHGDTEGRQLFTLALFSVLVGRRMFRPISVDMTQLLEAPPPEYAIVGEMLMPRHLVRSMDLSSLDAIRTAADSLRVTPSALVVRSQNLKIIGRSVAVNHLRDLDEAFRNRRKPQGRQPKPVNAVRKYNGRQFTRTMLAAVDQGGWSAGEFCRVVGAKQIGPEDLDALREAVK